MTFFLEAYAKTWDMCLAMMAFFVAVALLAHFIRGERLELEIPARAAFWACISVAFISASICLTLIDKPHLAVSEVTKEWLFMFSAFLGVPVFIPFFGGAAYACAHHQHGDTLKALPFGLLLLGLFGVGCAASNVHDLLWCGAITEGYTKHYAAGYDLDYFVAFGQWFGIEREILADYATLGPCALVLITGELLVAAVCFLRLRRLGEE